MIREIWAFGLWPESIKFRRGMQEEFIKNTEEYGKHYYKRSNVESTNHSKKVIHGNKVYSRLKSSRENEETLRWINHNINVLNRVKYEWDVSPLSED